MVETAGSRVTRLRICRKIDQIVQSWGAANKPGELADYSVCTTFGVKNKHFYLLHVRAKNSAIPISSAPF